MVGQALGSVAGGAGLCPARDRGAWQRQRFRDHWTRLSRRAPGRPAIPKEVRELIRDISTANPRWGSPRILGELRKLGIPVAKSTVETYRVRAARLRRRGEPP